MLWDMLCGGLFHRHIMTSGGRMARPATTVQPESEFTLPNTPAMHTANAERGSGDFDRFRLHRESVGARAERRCSRMHMQPQADTSVPFGAQPGAEDHRHFKCCAVRSRTAQNSSIRYSQGDGQCWAPSREPYAVDRRRSHRVDRGCDHPRNAGARRRQHTRLDERAMAR